ncbi:MULTISPECIES: exodeoxyribonuclease III [unclassified Pseudactinotalea]|uniref:exodeoxyribonuclease III n=1 Tax=unclassified Pseudactinotalea TaxID=2649176 RepID=UPI00128DA9F5|nr:MULTISPECIES: exodeoxyribonuclease III [unclassified Pseudactinotalea]MPV51382.1 exodeoxyribonuclease III [Pseudactinotalea sp. HY160]QGH70656.1 exodeoxyribonuclease III [Pseudactinotalea sp. HY158]
MRIATWNVNSIRARAERVAAWLEASDVDVLAIQETKCSVEQFPALPFEALGYEVVAAGYHQWNGVAICSRVGMDDVAAGFAGQPAFGAPEPRLEARALGATCGGVRVWSMYVPNGRSLSDPHYDYKLAWLRALASEAGGWTGEPTLLLGDWNVAPRDEDVWDVEVFAGATHVSEPEREALAGLERAGFSEITRAHTAGQYTYWDYQRLAFPKNNGMRIDLAFANPPAAARVTSAWIDRDERKGKGASDHVPVVVELD